MSEVTGTLEEDVIADLVEKFERGMTKQWMVETHLETIHNMMEMNIIPKGDVLRVEINEDGTVNILDFSLVTSGGRENFRMPQEEVAPWIMETVSMLRIAPEGDLLPELGFKVSDLLYYIIDRTGESK